MRSVTRNSVDRSNPYRLLFLFVPISMDTVLNLN